MFYHHWSSALLLLAGAVLTIQATTPSRIPNSQPLIGEPFLGHAVEAAPLGPKFQYEPLSSLMHQDAGNTGSTDYTGPLGRNSTVTTATTIVQIIIWSKAGQMVAGLAKLSDDSMTVTYGLAAVNAGTLEIEATWTPPIQGEALSLAYMDLREEDSTIVVSSKQGRIYIVQLSCGSETPSFHLLDTIDLRTANVLGSNETLLNSMFDAEGNIWFTTGSVSGPGDMPQPSTTIGYVEPNGKIHSLHIPYQTIENGIAISGTNFFVVTGPSANDDHKDAEGYLYCFKPGPGSTISTVWRTTYSAGDARKPGAFARGSGSTPALLGDQYIAITDNANSQVNLKVYHQNTSRSNEAICSIPLFKPGASNTDNGFMVHLDDNGVYGIVIQNNYNGTAFYVGQGDINGPFNNFSSMAPGMAKVNVAADGSGCELAWEVPVRMTALPVLSTRTGLIYGYDQDEELARQGVYSWYASAFDWRTGETVWRVRTGTGGTFNNNYLPGTLGPDGTFYQAVVGGVLMVKDGGMRGI